jgi:hypothetical protein
MGVEPIEPTETSQSSHGSPGSPNIFQHGFEKDPLKGPVMAMAISYNWLFLWENINEVLLVLIIGIWGHN